MLLKVFKYSFKSTIKPVAIISACIPVLAIIIALSFRLGEIWAGTDFATMLLVQIFAIVIVAVVFAPFIISITLIVNNLKDFTTDRAYLTFTLPVKPHEHILGRLFSLALQMLIAFLAEAVGILLAILILSGGGLFDVFSEIIGVFDVELLLGIASGGAFWDVMYQIENALITVEFVVLVIIGSMTFGLFNNNVGRKPFKGVIAFIVCYLIMMVISTITTVVSDYVYGFMEVTTFTYQIVNVIMIIVYALIIALTYFIAIRKIKKGINLE